MNQNANNKQLENNAEERSINPIVVILVTLAVVVVLIFVLSRIGNYRPVIAGTKAPDFTLPDVMNGGEKGLSDFAGKVVFLNFWATWCKPCEEEMPSMQLLYDYLKGRPFEIVAVSVDSEGPDVVREFVEKYKLTFTILHDRSGALKNRYKTTGVPETFIIDQNGVIAEKFWGARDWRTVSSTATIMELLDKGPRPGGSYAVGRGR